MVNEKGQTDEGISFVVIPIEILQNKELSCSDKILYGYLSIFKKQCCFQSNEDLANMTGLSVRTVTNALTNLAKLEYIFIEFINDNNAKRRIYTVFDNPKKLKYLINRGYLGSFAQAFPQSSKNCVRDSKSCVMSSKNCVSQNGGESRKNCYHRIIKEKENIADSPAGLAGKVPASRLNREDFDSEQDYEKAFYARNTMCLI